ncbi:hypothetical protein EKO27_g7217 [Xylaria grammica]|uniref:FAD-binding PCMH-type domain-containing protein n=1 Tax=Xylaria grammica TaxID=363999 RepID=A0A439D0I5_9PEZI|nr:hypothetical protein EKO27_g7217 [Xylaria grammica]
MYMLLPYHGLDNLENQVACALRALPAQDFGSITPTETNTFWTPDGHFFRVVLYYIGLSSSKAQSNSFESALPLSEVPLIQHDITKSTIEAAMTEFEEVLGSAHITTSRTDIDYHASSDWMTHPAKDMERFSSVVFPASMQNVAKLMKICHRRRIPVTGYSGGTSLEGHFVPTHGGVCFYFDFQRMDRVISLHKDDLDVVVQSGVGWESLNDQLAEDNLYFPPSPGPGVMIDGMVLSLTVVLPDGTIIKTRQRPRKSSAGHDLTKLFIGSEGTLGLVTEAALRLTVRPQSTSVAVSTSKSIRDAASCVAKVVSNGIPVAAVEVLDGLQMRCINEAGATLRSWTEAPTLFFKFSGSHQGVDWRCGRSHEPTS